MQGKIIGGIILIFLGLYLIIKPSTVSTIIKKVYEYSPFLRDEKQRLVRTKFIVFFGIIWILVGLFIMFFGP
jgi:cadmium resistance protein CadD (predicted permease)